VSAGPLVNPLAGSPLERLGHLRSRQDWVDGVLGNEETRFVPTQGARNLFDLKDTPRAALLRAPEVESLEVNRESFVLLGALNQQHFFSVPVEERISAPESMEFRDLRGFASILEPWEASLLAYARAMANWHRHHRFCARCGSPTGPASAGHARVCQAADCARHHFPKVDPAIIVLVSDGERCLLGRQASWPEGRYSTIAGFVEPGESLEDAVRREVLEETGVRVSDVTYHSSQPWPFPSALMLGFLARAETREIELLDGELAEAKWISREDIRSGQVILSPPVSIAYALIRHWFDSRPGSRLDELPASGPEVWRRDRSG
jgi:NAD+ diphosphatase